MKIIDTPEQNHLKIAMAQIAPVWLNKSATIDRIKEKDSLVLKMNENDFVKIN